MLILAAMAMPGTASGEGERSNAGEPPLAMARQGVERIYRDGILPSGEPLKAVVLGDIPVQGTMFTCANCHLRSGLGTIEGTIVTPPTNGVELYATLHAGPKMSTIHRDRLRTDFRGADRRPAYDDETLARAIREGIDPAGKELDQAMPRYFLGEEDMALMVEYLRGLSSAWSPGVSDTMIRFATVVTEGVSAEDRAAMLDPLKAYLDDRNTQTRHQEKRAQGSPFYRQERYTSYRRLSLDVWELTGPAETWQLQLQKHYDASPVFALLGGISSGPWGPIHDFCEQNRIPNIFPVTEYPAISETDWYTLYFSRGLGQEGDAAARFVSRTFPRDSRPLIQVSRISSEGQVVADAFASVMRRLGRDDLRSISVAADAVLDEGFWKEHVEPKSLLLLWSGFEDLRDFGNLLGTGTIDGPEELFVSSGLLGESWTRIPDLLRPLTYLTYPFRLPAEERNHRKIVTRWLKTRGIPTTNLRIQSNMYFLGWFLSEVLMHMQADFYRDYFLDIIDMMRDQTYSITAYPRLSFGPGQRYASKGCYVVQLSPGENPDVIVKGDWVVH